MVSIHRPLGYEPNTLPLRHPAYSDYLLIKSADKSNYCLEPDRGGVYGQEYFHDNWQERTFYETEFLLTQCSHDNLRLNN